MKLSIERQIRRGQSFKLLFINFLKGFRQQIVAKSLSGIIQTRGCSCSRVILCLWLLLWWLFFNIDLAFQVIFQVDELLIPVIKRLYKFVNPGESFQARIAFTDDFKELVTDDQV